MIEQINKTTKQIKESFKNKSFKYGSYATISAVVFIALLITINILIGQANIKLDLTENKIYSISEGSYSVIDNLTEDINIYTIYETGKEDRTVKEMLQQYAKRSSKIKIENKDPYLLPQFTNKYTSENGEAVQPNSVIVESSNMYKVLTQSDLYTGNYNYMTGEYRIESIDIEPRITNAIVYVTGSSSCKIYYTEGHNERTLPESILKTMKDESMAVEGINLMLKEMPDDIDILISIAPEKDFTEEETNKINEFLSKNGRAVIFSDITITPKPNFDSILNNYGVATLNSLIIENDPNHFYQNPVYLIPQLNPAEITQPLIDKNYSILLLVAQAVIRSDIEKTNIEYQPLLSTSTSSHAKANLYAETMEKEEGDLDGPFDVAVAATNTEENGGKIVLIASSSLIDESVNNLVAGSNANFLFNSIGWLLGETDKITIRPKSITEEYLHINAMYGNIIIIFSVILLPLAILITGLVIWIRRKNK